MASRLPLILSQPARRDAVASDLIENIVAAALLVPKLDANLIGDLSTMETGSTDHLCLQGHGRDVILATFLELSEAQDAWNALGLGGRFVECNRTAAEIRANAISNVDRRVFYFWLTGNMRIAALLDQCQELIASQAVQLVSIQVGGSGKSSNGLPILPVVSPTRPTTKPLSKPVMPAQTSQQQPHAIPSALSSSTAREVDDQDWSQVDKLVDELDALDI